MSTLYEISSLTAYIMSQPNMFSQVIGVVSKGDKIDVIYIFNSWVYFKYNNTNAYIKKENLKILNTEPTESKGSVILKYVDITTNNEIYPSEIITNLQFGNYSYEARIIYNYKLLNAYTQSINLTQENPNQTITFHYNQIFGNITIKYIDINLNTDIYETKTIENISLGTYTYRATNIPGYILSDNETKTVTITEDSPNATITFKYEEILGTVTIKYIDNSSSTKLLESDIFTDLKLGTYNYTYKNIPGYSLSSNSTQIVELTEDNHNVDIEFKYNELLGSVTIKYIDSSSLNEIVPATVISNLSLGTYSYTAKSFEGYKIIGNSTQSVTLNDTNINPIISFNYSMISGNITIKYLDSSTLTEIAPSTTMSNIALGSYTYDAIYIDNYEILNDSSISITLTTTNPNQTISFKYNEIEIPEDLNWNEVPYISTYYIKPVVKPGEEVFIDYYITDYYHKEYLEEDYSETFTVTVRVEGQDDKLYHYLKAGDHQVSLGSFNNEGEQKFSILCTDKYGRNSHELFNFFLVQGNIEVKEYVMTENDLITYNIKNTDNYEVKKIIDLSSLDSKDSTTVKSALIEVAKNIIPESKTYVCVIADTDGDGKPDNWWGENQVVYANDYDKNAILKESTNTRKGLQQLLDDKKEAGYNKLRLLPGIYRIDHQQQIYIPSEFTLDMNGSILKQNQFTGYQSLMIDINNCFNSHLINGTIEGDYYSHDYANSGGNSEGILGVSISSSSKYCSYDNILIKDITGYGAGNGIAYTRDNISHTYLSYKDIGNSFKLGDIDRSTGASIASNSRTTSDFIDISGYESIGYLSISKYLGYQGNDCGTWNIICHFYDTNKNFIKSIDSYQYRRIRVPSKSRYIKITILNTVYPTNLTLQYFRVPTHCSFTNIKFENCRAVGLAQSAMNDMLVENCTFTRSGQALARCAYDAEDGWDMMQDCFLRNLKFINNSLNDIVIFAGHNFVFENNINGKLIVYERCNSYTVRNCNNLINAFIGNKSRVRTGYRRFYNNTVMRSINIDGGTNWPMIAKDCRILNRADGSESNKYLRCTIGQDTFPTSKLYDYGLGRAQYIKCNIQNIYSLHNYMGNYYECKINNMVGEFQKGSTTTLFSNCELYNMRINILHDDNFIVTFNGCTIKESTFDELQQGIGVNISFINCNIDISTSLTKLRTCSLQKPMLFENNIITGSSADGLINFYQDYSPSWGIVQQDNVTLKNNNITLYYSPYVIIGLTRNILNYVNIISISNKFTPNTLLLCNPEAKLSSNIKITEN